MKVGEEEITAYPLAWPTLRPRSKSRERAKFGRVESETKTYRRLDGSTYQSTSSRRDKLTLAGGRDRAIAELQRFGANNVVISTNLKLRQDGLPAGGQAEPADPGVAVYFKINGKPRVIACDKWDRVADNLAAIAKTIEAQRAMLRHGAVTADQIFAGFKALPDSSSIVTPLTVEQAAEMLQRMVSPGSPSVVTNIMQSRDTFTTCYRSAAATFHPDRNGGVERPEWHNLQRAKEVLELHFTEGQS